MFRQDHRPKGVAGLSEDCLREIPVCLGKGYIPEGVETAVKLGVKSWFSDVGLQLN